MKPGEPMQTDEAYDDYYDAAKKDGEVIQGRNGGQIDLWVLVNQINGTKPPRPVVPAESK